VLQSFPPPPVPRYPPLNNPEIFPAPGLPLCGFFDEVLPFFSSASRGTPTLLAPGRPCSRVRHSDGAHFPSFLPDLGSTVFPSRRRGFYVTLDSTSFSFLGWFVFPFPLFFFPFLFLPGPCPPVLQAPGLNGAFEPDLPCPPSWTHHLAPQGASGWHWSSSLWNSPHCRPLLPWPEHLVLTRVFGRPSARFFFYSNFAMCCWIFVGFGRSPALPTSCPVPSLFLSLLVLGFFF